jgi:hypothetical protein
MMALKNTAVGGSERSTHGGGDSAKKYDALARVCVRCAHAPRLRYGARVRLRYRKCTHANYVHVHVRAHSHKQFCMQQATSRVCVRCAHAPLPGGRPVRRAAPALTEADACK